MIDGPAGGLHLRRRAARQNAERPLLLMVHGSTYSVASTFDLPVQSFSMMDVLALAGIEVWALDITGYGGSSRPPSMERNPETGAPVSRTLEAIRDVEAAVTYLLARCDLPSLTLLGWSWGTSITGALTAAMPSLVDRLALLAPQWLREGRSVSDPGGKLGSYRVVAVADVGERWLTGVADAARAEHIPAGALGALEESLLAEDALFSAKHPGRFRAPSGTVGRPVYDPGTIRCPVLVVHGEWDQELPSDMARRYFAQLTGAPYRELIEISSSTHSLVLERNRLLVFKAVIAFLFDRHDPAVWG